MTDFGFGELTKLAADLTGLADIIPREVKKSLQQSAIETKKDYAKDAKRSMPSSVAKKYAPTIDYTVSDVGDGKYQAEIGPNLERYGGKGGFASFAFLDDPDSAAGIRTPPARARPRAEKFAEKLFPEKLELAVTESHRKANL